MIIEFGYLNGKLLMPLLFPLFYQLRLFIHRKSNPFYQLFTAFLGFLLAGLLYIFFYRKRSLPSVEVESEPRRRNRFDNRIRRRRERLQRKKENKKYAFILILVFLIMIPMALDAFTKKRVNINFRMSTSLLYFMFFYVLFSRLIIRQILYRHRTLSIFVIMLFIPLLIVFYFINEGNNDSTNLFINSLFLILIAGLYSLFDVLCKKLYNSFYDSPYHFMFVIGLMSLSILFLYESISLIITGVKDNDFNGIIFQIKNNYSEHSFWYILIVLGDAITSFLWLAGKQLTIFYFTPSYLMISECISQIITTIIEKSLKNYNIGFIIGIYAIYIIIIVFSCVYNEIFIFNFCSLKYNTTKNILNRAVLDEKYDLEVEEEDDIMDDNIVYI